MRYPLAIFVALALFQSALVSGEEEVGHGKRKRETDGLLEAFSTLRKTLTETLGDAPAVPANEGPREKRESIYWGSKEDPMGTGDQLIDLMGVAADEKPTLGGIRDTARELISAIRKLKTDPGDEGCKSAMVETMKKIIALVLQLINQLVNYIMKHINA